MQWARASSRWGGDSCAILTLIFFFFQAEDGIRDLTVTGVQTCALPISWLGAGGGAAASAGLSVPRPSRARQGCNDRRRLAGHVASFDVFFPYFLDFLRLLTRNAAFTPVPGGRAAGGVCPARRGKRPGRCAHLAGLAVHQDCTRKPAADRKSTRLNSSHSQISYAV